MRLHLRVATDAEKPTRDALTHAAWGEKLTVPHYLERERRLRAHRWAREAMATWLLADDEGPVLASCETFRVPALLGARAAGNAHAIASVYTEPALRGRGYAGAMMALLADAVRARDPDATSLVLFSDVGAPLYERAGFVARPAVDLALAPAAGDPRDGVDALLGDADLKDPKTPTGGYVLAPGAAQLDWYLERERTYAELLGRARPVACGARAGGGSSTWQADFKNGVLCVLTLDGNPAELDALLLAARRVAARAGLARVVAWETPELAAVTAPRAPRDGSLPMLRPLSPEVRPEAWTWIPRALWV